MIENFYQKLANNKATLQVLIYRRPNLRDENLEYERFMNRDVLVDIYESMKQRPDIKHLFLSFPEQWLNIIEQRDLFNRIDYYLPNIESVEIKTHSVYIIQCTKKENCKIVDETIDETSDMTQKLYNNNPYNLFDLSAGLNIVTPKK